MMDNRATWGYPPRKAEPQSFNPFLMLIAACAVALAASVGASIIAKGIANHAHFNATYGATK